MIPIHWIRHHPDALDEMLVKRGKVPLSRVILDKDVAFRRAETELQRMRAQANQYAKDIALTKNHAIRADLVVQARTLKEDEKRLSAEIKQKAQRDDLIWALPNRLCDDVPPGKSDLDNIEILRWKEVPVMDHAKDHMQIAQALNGVHPGQASHVSGSRFLYLSGVVARLERALSQWMLDTHTQQFGFTEISPPYLVKKETMASTGQLPKFQEDLFCTTDGRYLIPTGEVPLVALGAGRSFQIDEMPLCLTALTPCFRAEAGAAGQDTYGMIRQHQFHKVELVVLCQAQDEAEWHQKLTEQARWILEALDLPYRQILLCAGDTGHGAQKTYDLEVWMPSQGSYRELSSISRCGDYQSRRMSCRIKREKDMQYVHTLNASGVAVGRALAGILENGQREEGRCVVLPKVLHRYMGAEALWVKE